MMGLVVMVGEQGSVALWVPSHLCIEFMVMLQDFSWSLVGGQEGITLHLTPQCILFYVCFSLMPCIPQFREFHILATAVDGNIFPL